MPELIYPELSYKILGIFFDVYNELGSGYQEKIYQRAVAKRFTKLGVRYQEQLPVQVRFEGEPIARYLLDFLIDGKVVVEVKVGNRFYMRHTRQVLEYLRAHNLRLGIVILMTSSGVRAKRVLNPIRIDSQKD